MPVVEDGKQQEIWSPGMSAIVDRHSGSPEIVPSSSVVSSHATSEGLIIYYRKDDGSLGIVLEPRQVMPKQVIADRSA